MQRQIVTTEDLQFYQDNGFWISPKLFTAVELEHLQNHYYDVLNGKYETGISPHGTVPITDGALKKVVKLTGCVWVDSTISRAVLNPVIGEIACQLMQVRTVRYWRDHLWYKPPDSGYQGIVGWHQDYNYWRCAEPAELITAWIALDDVSEESGSLEFVPGSHKWGLLGEGDLYSSDLEALQERIEKQVGKPFETIPAPLKAGQVSFHHCLTVHGSRPNNSIQPRISLSTHLFAEGTVYRANRSIKPFSNEKFLSGEDGEPFAGPFFPVVYSLDSLNNPWSVKGNYGLPFLYEGNEPI